MRSRDHHRRGRTPRRALQAAALALALAATAAACDRFDELLDVEAPSRIPASELQDPSKAELLLNGAIADFECALGSYIVLGGVVGEELVDATQTANRWPYDRRVIAPSDSRYATFGCTDLGVYTPLSTARWAADAVLASLEGWSDEQVPQRTAKIATAAAYSGYSHLLLGEAFCTGVLLDADLTPGGEVSSSALLERAVERFTRAIEAAQAANQQGILDMARVGRARALLRLGKGAEAAADARLVTPGFAKVATASQVASRRYNRVYAQNNQTELVSVGPQYHAFRHMGVADPRVPTLDTGRQSNDEAKIRIFVQEKYDGLDAPLPLATWDEAQLILAEALGGQEAVDVINAFHARAGLPPFSSNDPAEIRAHLIEERRAELFLEGHHLGDIIHYDLPLTPAPGTTFPKGGSYGPQGAEACLPLPNVERLNNPKIGA